MTDMAVGGAARALLMRALVVLDAERGQNVGTRRDRAQPACSPASRAVASTAGLMLDAALWLASDAIGWPARLPVTMDDVAASGRTGVPMSQTRHDDRIVWREVLRAVSMLRAGDSVTVRFFEPGYPGRLMADADRLAHITYLDREDALVVSVRGRRWNDAGLEHIIEQPRSVMFDTLFAEAVQTVTIDATDGTRTIVTLHTHEIPREPSAPAAIDA